MNGIRQCPTMTLHEMCEALRANVIQCTENIIGEMIVEGKFPFAVGYDGGVKKTCIIFRAGFYKWLDEQMGEKAVRVGEG